MTHLLILSVAGLAGVALLIHLASIALVWPRFLRTTGSKPAQAHPAITVLRPVCGLDPDMDETLASTFAAMSEDDEAIFCIAAADDPAIPVVKRLIDANPQVTARLLIGDDRISGNPKLNNLAKGWAAARNDWIVMIDSNVLLPDDYIQRLFDHWTPGTGLVTSPPAGIRPVGFWAAVEAGFLNSYQDRWQLTSDQIGNGFAQGKVLMWRRALLEQAGGLAVLGHDLAEDVASTKVVRAAGLKVRVLDRPLPQPLGRRTADEVWLRQLRWARVRRSGFPGLYAVEPLSTAALPMVAVAGLAIAGAMPAPLALAYPVLWYGAEWALARRAGWPSSPVQVLAWLLRDTLIPAVWLTAFASRGFVWRGNAMHDDDTALHPAE
ncbi:ceramide glucosyltransferase [Frigidibacter sp. ROC022]|uniref:ceramide glucosyltransferase n=1 Tax=Frigidibacter sp. ROC022 TaxID=2971796 RepID=UPI00215AB618|nr:ceramide glucosyltransferase [Frigidibacter sp. ROC022]MCR8725901.1 ceramide glucosyltransferase [Frigidibacter sp. ROC022]